ncbi:MsnO8 family LLM class oxidoreductase [Nocardiopsis ansamitocini]|uniref:Methylene-tetrahydromethanopterin reductase n=1 Tax=Nocardiopsis ansamitocini TaxID=1670832 RepID=A0A9W6UGV7_9ACTN|nr:MsnO8 family LLM class oxidoreductase [Nocardiopsis ansamitocini]GLU45663.1 methylene-tetrahydromethanopterin reductase [Nocardiopsis ansamitocini]
MTSVPNTPRLSILDRSRISEGRDSTDALRATVESARQAEALGYHRFWVAEHHSVPGIAGSAPTVLAAALASATTRIRIGTGGVMLPNHRPLVVAEQFGVLESLFPGRIDMGVGRSVAFTGGIRRALGTADDAADGFPGQLAELLGYFTGTQHTYPGVRAHPGQGLDIPAFVLATGAGAETAASLGLPLVIAAVNGEPQMRRWIERYRDRFRPSARAPHPYVVVSTDVAVADTAEEARRLLMPEAWSITHARTRGVFPPSPTVEDVLASTMTAKQRELFEAALDNGIAGDEEEAAAALSGLVARTGADEVLVTTSTHDPGRLREVYARLARAAGIAE